MDNNDGCRASSADLREYQEVQALVENLYNDNNKSAYESLKQLEKKSEEGSVVYLFMDSFARMLEDENSYIRNRGILLIAANAKWDEDNKIDEIIDEYLRHIMDIKPITARQCIKCLPRIAVHKKELREDITAALKRADPQRYPGSMSPLVQKDIEESLKKIAKYK